MNETANRTSDVLEFSGSALQGSMHIPEGYLEEFDRRFSDILYIRQEAGVLHNSFEWGYTIYEHVKNHNIEGLTQLLSGQFSWRCGTLAMDELRSTKNACLCLVSYVVQNAIHERLTDNETFYNVSDACIQLIEESATRQEVLRCTYASLIKLADLLQQARQTSYHYLVRRAKEYIFKHFHERITVEDIASALSVSTAYLSRVFRDAEQISLKQYIQKERIERAKNLLRCSNDPIQSISHCLGFVSQSHFTECFRKITGLTPLKYRNQFSEIYKSKL